jgi:hypothetical protein
MVGAVREDKRSLVPGAIESRVRNAPDVGCLTMIAVAWVCDTVWARPRRSLRERRSFLHDNEFGANSKDDAGYGVGNQFIEGEPMKPATNVLLGWS